MASITQKTYGTIASALTTELNALAAAASCAPGPAQDNTTLLDLFDDLELTVDFVSAPAAGGYVSVFLLPSVDGTNYADGSATVAPQGALLVCAMEVRADTAAQRLCFQNVAIPPGLFKYMITDNTSQAFPASGSILKRRPHSLTVA